MIPSNMGANGKPGASLYGWKEFFPNAHIFGADIDKDILFQTEHIHTYYCDQTNPESIQSMWSQKELEEPFDIIVEDGLHTFEANVCFFENSIHKLKKGGFYIIEDIHVNTLEKWKNQIEQWKQTYSSHIYKLLTIPSERNHTDNTLLIVQHV
jgi:SAM-dependent methyltransferase